MPTWGTVAMGMMSAGAGLLTVFPQVNHGFVVTWWALATVLGVVTTFWFVFLIMVRPAPNPQPAWGLSVVPPMLSATNGAILSSFAQTVFMQVSLIVVSTACFFMSFILGLLLFSLAYRNHFAVEHIPINASVSSWIPLGVVGQSAAAVQSIAIHTSSFLLSDATRATAIIAELYGLAMLLLAVPVVAFAVFVTVRGFVGGMKFSPGWWALTFPVGTLALGMSMLSDQLREHPLTMDAVAGSGAEGVAGAAPGVEMLASVAGAVGVGAMLVMCCTWTLCATSSVRAVVGIAATRNAKVQARAEAS